MIFFGESVGYGKLITRKEAAEILGISIATLDAARNNGRISFVQYVQNGAKSQGMKQFMAGGGVALIGTTLVPLLSGLFG